MADFVQKSVTKTAVRALTAPIADAATLNTIVNTLISTNPLGCTPYEVGGVTMDPIARTRESYSARIAYENNEGRTVGTITARAPGVAAFGTVKSTILSNTALATAMGGDPVNLSDRKPMRSWSGARPLGRGLLPDLLPRCSPRLSYGATVSHRRKWGCQAA
jgi:hypothetical protein